MTVGDRLTLLCHDTVIHCFSVFHPTWRTFASYGTHIPSQLPTMVLPWGVSTLSG